MKIINKTTWDTNALRKLFKRCADNEGFETKGKIIEVVNSRWGDSYSGLANVGNVFIRDNGESYGLGKWIRIRLPNYNYVAGSDGKTQKIDLKQLDSVRLAKLFIHELLHNQGVRHKEMLNLWKDDSKDFSWANSFVILRKGDD